MRRQLLLLWTFPRADFDVQSLARLGVKRISVGSSLARAAYTSFLEAAREMRGSGTFTYARELTTVTDFDALFQPSAKGRAG